MKTEELVYNAHTLDAVLAEFFKATSKKDPHKVLWLCPSRRLVRDRTSRFAKFLQSIKKGGSFLPRFRTLNDFAVEQLGLKLPYLKYINQEERLWTVEEAFFEDGKKTPSGISGELSALISSFKAYISNDTDEIRKALKKAYNEWSQDFQPALDAGVFERAKERLDRVLKILERYERLKQERGLFDEFDAYYIEELPCFGYDLVVVDSFQDFYPAQQSFLEKIVLKSPRTVFLKHEFRLPDENGLLLSDDSGKKVISVSGYLTPVLEVKSVAEQVASLIDSGVRPEEILVVVPELSEYARTINTVFEEKGIKTNISQGYRLSVSPAGSFILSLLNYLKDSGYAHSFYELALSFLVAGLEPEKRSAYTAVQEFFMKNDIYAEEDFLKNLRLTFSKRNLNEMANIFEKIEALRSAENLSNALNLIEQIIFLVYEFAAHDKKAEKDLEAILDGINTFRSSKIFEAEKDKPFDAGRLISVFKTILARPSKSFTGDIAEGVQVSGILETRGIVSDFIFLVGFTDRAFPGNPLKTYILPDGIKHRLKIPTADEYLQKQKTDFYRLISSARYGVFISYYQQEKNEVFLESRFITELKSLFRNGLVRGAIQVSVEDFAVQERKLRKADKLNLKKGRKPAKDSVSLSVSTLRQIVACRAKFYLIANEFSAVHLPLAVPTVQKFGNFFHKMITDFVTSYSALRDADFLQIKDWVEQWVDSNLNSGEFKAYRLDEFFGKGRIMQIGTRVLANLEEHVLQRPGRLQPEKEIENLAKSFIHRSTGALVTVRGRPDLVVYDNQGEVREIVDFKFFERAGDIKKRDVLEGYKFQLYLYDFLLSDAASPEEYNGLLSKGAKLVAFSLTDDQCIVEYLEPGDELNEKFKNYLLDAIEIAVKPEFPFVETCEEYSCSFSAYCPVAGGL